MAAPESLPGAQKGRAIGHNKLSSLSSGVVDQTRPGHKGGGVIATDPEFSMKRQIMPLQRTPGCV
jgi:hypothetical protein